MTINFWVAPKYPPSVSLEAARQRKLQSVQIPELEADLLAGAVPFPVSFYASDTPLV